MTHVRASPYYPQFNGKLGRFHTTVKEESLPFPLNQARTMVKEFTAYSNNVRPHSAIGCVAPMDKLNVQKQEIFVERDRKLEETRGQRRRKKLFDSKGKADASKEQLSP